MCRALRDHPHTLWGLLALPGVAFLLLWLASGHDGAGGSATAVLLHPTEKLSARLMIVTMAISPMRHILPASYFWRWKSMAPIRKTGVSRPVCIPSAARSN